MIVHCQSRLKQDKKDDWDWDWLNSVKERRETPYSFNFTVIGRRKQDKMKTTDPPELRNLFILEQRFLLSFFMIL